MKIIENTRRFLATLYARGKYARMVREAERLREESRSRTRVCVVTHPSDPSKLLYINKRGFSKMQKRGSVPFRALTDGAWYYTAGPDGRGGMTPEQKEARRRVFISTIASRPFGKKRKRNYGKDF